MNVYVLCLHVLCVPVSGGVACLVLACMRYVCMYVCVCLCVCVWFYTSSLASQVALASTGYFDADIYSQSDKFAGYLTSIAPNDGDEVCY